MIRPFAILITCASCLPTASFGDERLSDAREAVAQWVAVEQSISREAAASKEKIGRLRDMIAVAQNEILSLENQIAGSKEVSTTADKRREELIRKRDRIAANAKAIEGFLAPTESRLRQLKKRLPAPLQGKLAPFYKRLPADPGQTSLGIAERMQTVVGILAEIQKFDTIVTVVEELRKLSGGSTGEVRTIYFGLGAAYYISAGGADAGTGLPGPDGWTWNSQPDLADAILDVLNAAEGQARETQFVALPVKLTHTK